MNFDALTAVAVRRELAATLSGGRVQRVVLPDERSVGLEIYAGGTAHQLLFCAEPGRARVHLVQEKLKRGVESASPLLLLLRRYVRGARLADITQPPLERILAFEFSYVLREPEEHGTVTLVAETIGRQSNLILLDSTGAIMDSHRRVGPGMSRYRQIVPHRDYVAPPPVDRPAPSRLRADEVRLAAANRPDEAAWRILLGAAAGVSPLLARECVHRAGLAPAAAGAAVGDWSAVIGSLREIVEAVESGPCEAWLAFKDGRPKAYSPYEPTQYPLREIRPSISGAIAEYVVESGAPVVAGETDLRRDLRRRLSESRRRSQARLVSLRRSAEQGSEAGALREAGEMLLAHQHEIPTRATKFEFEGVTVNLDPQLSVVQNAQGYFKRYRSARAAAERSPRALRKAKLELQFLEQTILDAELATTDPELRGIGELLNAAEGRPAPKRRSRRRRASTPPGPRSFDVAGWSVLVGRNASQNHAITFRNSQPDDIWLHARGVPGAHVVLRAAGRSAPEEVVLAAAGIAAYYSASGGESRAEVDVTVRKNVRSIRGGGPGQVTYRGERTLLVAPADPAELASG